MEKYHFVHSTRTNGVLTIYPKIFLANSEKEASNAFETETGYDLSVWDCININDLPF